MLFNDVSSPKNGLHEYDITHRFCLSFFFILILLIICYSNTFFASWQFDDFVNIVKNSDIKITEFSPGSLKKAVYAAPQTTRLSRPVAFLFFAINWYFGKESVFGYHLVNLFIHCLASIFLFLTIFYLLLSPILEKRFTPDERYFIAFLSAVLWAVNPIQTQAVTYIVQRMAEMAGMFYIMGVFFYVRGRLYANRRKQIFAFFATAICFLLAIGSKPNAATMPLTLFLIEFLFFQDIANPRIRMKAFLLISIIGLLIAAAGFFIFFSHNISRLLGEYNARPFSLGQRLLTEFRILVFYVSEIFYPVPTRLSIEHVYPLSTSLWFPPTTLLCIASIFLLLFGAFYMVGKLPVVSFAILFFLGNHVIESSVIALELVFEHRNYIPSMFLFFPISIWVLLGFKYYYHRNKTMYYILVSAMTFLIICLGTGTYVRNMAWKTQKTLWQDAMQKAPGSPRPYHNLAWGCYEQKGDHASALSLYNKATSLQHVLKKSLAGPYYNMGRIFDELKDYQQAIRYYRKAMDISFDYIKPHYLIAFDFIKEKRFSDAEKEADYLLSRFPEDASNLWLKGLVCLNTNRLDEALFYFRRSLFADHSGWRIYFYIGTTLNLSGDYPRAYWFLRQAESKNPEQDSLIQLSMALNRFLYGSETEAELYINKFIDIVGMTRIQLFFDILPAESHHIPFGFEKIYKLIRKAVVKRAKEVKNIASNLHVSGISMQH